MYFYIILINLLFYLKFHKTAANETNSSVGLLNSVSKRKVILKVKPIQDFQLIIPEDCKENNICENIPDYPQHFVNSITNRLLNIGIRLNVDVEDTAKENDILKESEQLCYSKEKVFFPQAARDRNKKWYLLLNSMLNPQNYIGQICRSVENKTSSCTLAMFLINYYGKCVQKYIQRKMIALNEEMDKVIYIYVDVPSCCTCDLFREEFKILY